MRFTCVLLMSVTSTLVSCSHLDTLDYGVDVSFPIHYGLDRKIVPHAHNRYSEMIRGCYKLYSKRECDASERSRMKMNIDQPPTQHNYTELGFKKLRVPDAAWESLLQFYHTFKSKKREETWPRGNSYVNHWDSPSLMVSFEDSSLRGGWEVKNKIWNGVKPVIEEWVGHKIKPTSLYGIRIYQDGSILSTHVDRLPLVSSCIIQVDQDVDEPWPIEVYSHAGKAYNVTMQPGDMVLYESSTVLHGRPFPMKGRHYANIFVHFEPVDHTAMNKLDHEEDTIKRVIRARAEKHGQKTDGSFFEGLFSSVEKKMRPHQGGHEQSQHDEDLLQEVLDEIDREEDQFEGMHAYGADSIVEKRIQKDLVLTGAHQHPVISPSIQSDRESLSKKNAKHAALLYAASHGDYEKLVQLFDVSHLHTKDENDWQLLHEAVRSGEVEAVKFLVDSGADLGAKVKNGGGALWLSKKYWDVNHPVTEYLFSIGAPDDLL